MMNKVSAHSEIKRKWESQGYAVIRGVIHEREVALLLSLFNNLVLKNKDPLLRQSTKFETHVFTPHGYMKNGLLNPHMGHLHSGLADFATQILNILTSHSIQKALSQAVGLEDWILAQSMLFDFSPATQPHQDCVYLDSLPNGHLVGAWVALEDIPQDAGRFYVLPFESTPLLPQPTREAVFKDETYMKMIEEVCRDYMHLMIAPEMKKGDVIFWRSDVIHGAFAAQDPKKSRKSLTAHYLPEGFDFGNSFGDVYARPKAIVSDRNYPLLNGMRVFSPSQRALIKIYGEEHIR